MKSSLRNNDAFLVFFADPCDRGAKVCIINDFLKKNFLPFEKKKSFCSAMKQFLHVNM